MDGSDGHDDADEDVVIADEVIGGRGDADARRGAAFRRRDSSWIELARFLPDVARLLRRLARDERVPWNAKVAALGAVLYVISPVDLVPDVFGRAGRMDDAFVAARALRYLFQEAGYTVMHDLWDGSDDGFALLLVLAGVER